MAGEYISRYKGSEVDDAIALVNLLDSLRGAANGLATLDSNGKLVEMPSASDVNAIPISQKDSPNGVASLNSDGRLIQMPTSEEVFSKSTLVENGTNFNSLILPGIYYQLSDSETTNNTNAPENTSFYMIILKDTFVLSPIQIFYKKDGSAIYVRSHTGSNFGNWIRYLSEFDNNFKSGDTYIIPNNQQMYCGIVTQNNTYFRFSILLPKKCNDLTITINSLKCNIRSFDGKYLSSSIYVNGGTELINNSTFTVTPEYINDNILTILIEKSSWGTTNNTPTTIELNYLELQFD